MSKERIVVYDSEVYHMPECRYVNQMKKNNILHVTRRDAIRHGCRICKCCNSIDYHLKIEDPSIVDARRRWKLETKVVKGSLYVKTSISCWKIVYLKSEERFILYHRNKYHKPVNFNHPEYELYHRQNDVPYSDTIAKYLNYIYEHDRYMAAEQAGVKFTQFSGEKNRKRAERHERKRARNRVDYLFRCLERGETYINTVSLC